MRIVNSHGMDRSYTADVPAPWLRPAPPAKEGDFVSSTGYRLLPSPGILTGLGRAKGGRRGGPAERCDGLQRRARAQSGNVPGWCSFSEAMRDLLGVFSSDAFSAGDGAEGHERCSGGRVRGASSPRPA